MTVKDKVISILEKNKDKYLSGEFIAEQLNVSRTAIWKNIKLLQKEGYNITAVTNKGYCLSSNTDVVSENGIRKYLKYNDECRKIHVLKTIDSTNSEAKRKAMSGETDGCIVVANEQFKGRGRFQRNFHSPADSGVYFSLLLRPEQMLAEDAVQITTIAAVAMCEAIEKISSKKAEIKWVNDIFIDKKKVCGILTEAALSMENGMIEYAILGIGVNVYSPNNGFSSEIKGIAGSVLETQGSDAKNRVVAECLNAFYKYYLNIKSKEYLSKYRERSFVIGKKVKVVSIDKSVDAVVLDIDDKCHLIVKYENGSIGNISSGEISIKL